MSEQFMHGSPILLGDNTVPGVQIPEEFEKLLPTIFKECTKFGLDYYPTVIQMLTYDEISEIASYGGFPVRFPHWSFGMEYEEMQKGYAYGNHRIYEMVVNTSPCYIYCLDSNLLVDNVTVTAHALGHCDFFKNNIYFKPTNQNMMNKLANHGSRVRKYIQRWGKEAVTEFIDNVMRIETLVDPAKAWERKVIKNPIIQDTRKYRHPRRLKIQEGHEYMDSYLNDKKWLDKQKSQIETADLADQIDIFKEPTKDIMGFLKTNAPLKPWQKDIMSMLYEESMYFAPQRTTKMLNEGWASYVDYNIMARSGLTGLGQKASDMGIFDYAKHKMGVLGGKYSMNPYKLGFCFFMDIEERWNKGQFGPEWDAVEDFDKRMSWDKKVGLGSQKVFEVRKYFNDFLTVAEFFTPEFCEKYKFFDWKRTPNGEYRIASRDAKAIRKKLMQKFMNGGLPEIKLTDPNHRGKGHLLIQHDWEGRTLLDGYTKATMQSMNYLWKNTIVLATRNKDEEEIVYVCSGQKDSDITSMLRTEYEKKYA